VSNTPLQWVIESNPRREDTLAFQVDLWSSEGALPRNLAEVATRHKEIQFSSRTRASTGQFKNVHRVQRALDALLRRLPADFEENDDLKILKSVASDKVYNIIHLRLRITKVTPRPTSFRACRCRTMARGLPRRSTHAAPSRGSCSPHEPGRLDLERDGRE
jgi:NTE family protein